MAEKSSSSVYWEGLKSWMAVLREDFSGILLCSRNRGRMSLSGLCDLPKLEEYHEAIPRHPFTCCPLRVPSLLPVVDLPHSGNCDALEGKKGGSCRGDACCVVSGLGAKPVAHRLVSEFYNAAWAFLLNYSV